MDHAEQAELTMSINNTSSGTPRSKKATLSLINDNNNTVNLVENNVVRASLTHNKYNSGWNAYYTTMDVNNKKVTIDGIDYYPISELPAIIQ